MQGDAFHGGTIPDTPLPAWRGAAIQGCSWKDPTKHGRHGEARRYQQGQALTIHGRRDKAPRAKKRK